MINGILASTSTLHGQPYLHYLLPDLEILFSKSDEVLFIPYARPNGISHDDYTAIAQKGLLPIHKKVIGIHTFENPTIAIQNAKNIFVGGGNTFVLVNQLYRYNLLSILKNQIQNSVAYLGTSAGSNICGITMQTTNDMPIVYPPSFKTLGIVPYNINPHYQDTDQKSIHMGETRETRINEFLAHNNIPVIGLREGSWIQLKNNSSFLKGDLSARIFRAHQFPLEVAPNTDLNKILLPDYI